jgi:excisionase family DNA binding protein
VPETLIPAARDAVDALVLTVPQARVALGGIGRELMYKLINSGELRTVKIGGRRMIPRSAIVDLIEGGRHAA